MYNIRVAEWHTYFVGSGKWGFAIWAHNARYVAIDLGDGTYAIYVENSQFRVATFEAKSASEVALALHEFSARMGPHPNGATRLGAQRISEELTEELRGLTPTRSIRRSVNAGQILPFPDPALPGLMVTKRLHADHIVSFDTIVRMKGFESLTRPQMLSVVNNPVNFIGLSPTANTSKGSRSFAEWTKYKTGGIDVDSLFRQIMMHEEERVFRILQQQIDDLLK